MTTVENTFEGGSNGVAITTGNSGGASGTAFSNADYALYSTTRAAHGTVSSLLPPPDEPATAKYSYDLSGSGTRWIRAYLWAASWSSSPLVMYLGTSSLNFFDVILTTSQVRVSHYNGSSDSVIATIAVAPATSTWIRVEMQANTSGAAEIRLYNTGDGGLTGSASGSRTTAGTWDEVAWTNNGTADVYADTVGWSDERWLGSALPSSRRSHPIIGPSGAAHHAASW